MSQVRFMIVVFHLSPMATIVQIYGRDYNSPTNLEYGKGWNESLIGFIQELVFHCQHGQCKFNVCY